MIRSADTSDAEALCAIYNHYIAETTITFEEDPVSTQDMAERMVAADSAHPWLVWEETNNAGGKGNISGYAHASPWKSRCAYRYSVETSVYLNPNAQGRGIGSALYEALIATLDRGNCHSLLRGNCHSLLAGIALPNAASIALHEKLGFAKIGQFVEVGYKFDQWIDVGYWELLLPEGGPQRATAL